MTLISKVLNMSNYAVNNWTGLDAFSATYLSAEDMWGAWNGISGFLFKLLIKFSMMIWALISGLIAVVVIAVQVMSIKVEVCLRCCFLPLAIANCCGHEHHGGLAYIKRLLACMLYMVGIIICINVSGRVSASLMTGAANGGIIGPIDIARWWIACIAGPFAAVGSIAVMKSLLHEAMS